MRITALLLLTLLANCATANSDSTVCPPLVEYAEDFQAEAASDLDYLSFERPNSPVFKMISDYNAEREQLRACHE